MVTIIIPVYNFSDYLKEAIESCLRQKVTKEILIIDDCSTQEINKEALDLIHNDPSIRLIRNETNLSLAGSRNVGFSEAKYEWVLPLDSDDFLEGDSLDEMVTYIKPNVDVIYGNMYEGSLKRWIAPKQNFTVKDFQIDNPIFGCSLVRKEAWKKVGGYTVRPEPHKVHYEDYNFWAKLFANKSIFKYVNVPIYHHRYREASMSNKTIKDVNFYRDLAIEGIFPTLKVAFCVLLRENNRKLLEDFYESLVKYSEVKFGLLVFTDIPNMNSDKWTIVNSNSNEPIENKYKGYTHLVKVDVYSPFKSTISRFSF